ncbi:MAG: hypothetical protein N3A65_09390, partial [candidate division WOR-3 bacterium]|nr:hypothetical protein [candidate division WOR-3 bacterium]
NAYATDLLSQFPPNILINSHYIDQYFLKNFNFSVFPINFIESVVFIKKYINSEVNTIDLRTKINRYEQPYSYLYFTLFGPNTIYNIDFTRAITNTMGFYLGGVYSRHYKNSERRYLRTNAGYANFYCNQFIPLRLDIILTGNSYDTIINSDFSDITLTAGKDFYKFMIYRTACKVYDDSTENQFLTYGTHHKVLFNIGNLENTFEFIALTTQFNPGKFKNNYIEFSQNSNYELNNIIAGIGYNVNYASGKIFFEPAVRGYFQILNDMKLYVRTGLLSRRPDFIAQYGNDKFIDPTVNIIGNLDIEGETYFHREIGATFKNSKITLYNAHISNQIIYQSLGLKTYSAVNVDNEITGLEGNLVSPSIKGFSAIMAGNYLIYTHIPSDVPDFFVKFSLNWQRRTERSVMSIFTKFTFVNRRYDPLGRYYEPFLIISPGLNLEFLTLSLGVIFDNVTDTRPEDFSDIARRFGMEIKWEFWD